MKPPSSSQESNMANPPTELFFLEDVVEPNKANNLRLSRSGVSAARPLSAGPSAFVPTKGAQDAAGLQHRKPPPRRVAVQKPRPAWDASSPLNMASAWEQLPNGREHSFTQILAAANLLPNSAYGGGIGSVGPIPQAAKHRTALY